MKQQWKADGQEERYVKVDYAGKWIHEASWSAGKGRSLLEYRE